MQSKQTNCFTKASTNFTSTCYIYQTHRAITASFNSVMAIPTKYLGVGPPYIAPIVP